MLKQKHLARFNTSFLKQVISARFFFLISCISFTLTVVWIQSVKRNDEVVQEAIDNISRDLKYINVYRKPSKLPKDVKYILLWTPRSFSPFYFLGTGQKAFVDNNCEVINCYVTVNRYLFDGDITRFDAVAFNGRNLKGVRVSQMPKRRSMRQKYIFFNLESADNYPVCPERYDSYFNWTVTYKLNSDIPYPYLMIKNKEGTVVGPKHNMKWIEDNTDMEEAFVDKLKTKTKAIAWFVSSCSVRSKRNDFVWFLNNALSTYKLKVDVYGKCGTYDCPVEKKEDCDKMLERDYFFYLSMENSFADDYITEKVLTALQNNLVPIVFGAANYSRFLPPGSYLDARAQDVKTLAATVARLISSPKLYSRYFRWKHHYSYHDPTHLENVCSVCAALHNRSMMDSVKVYRDFRKWWNPEYEHRCSWWADDYDS